MYKPLHRGVNHAKTELRLPQITREQFDRIKNARFERPPKISEVLIPLRNDGTIYPTFSDFQNRVLLHRLRFAPVFPYQLIDWGSEARKKSMPRAVYEYRASVVEYAPKSDYRDLKKSENLNNTDMFNIGNNVRGSFGLGVDFGQPAPIQQPIGGGGVGFMGFGSPITLLLIVGALFFFLKPKKRR
jgi:hypothetical protein